MCRKILSAVVSAQEGTTQITPTAGVNILWGENAEQIFRALAGILDICPKESLVQESVFVQAEIRWPDGTLYGIFAQEWNDKCCMSVKYIKNPTVKNRWDLVKRFHKQRFRDARGKDCFFDGVCVKRSLPLGESNLILNGFYAFINAVAKEEKGRPLFLCNFLERLDEAVDLQPVFEALLATGRQIFIIVPQSYEIKSLEGTTYDTILCTS